MAQPLKILQLISSSGVYGAERVVLALAKSLRAAGHTVEVAIFENIHAPNTDLLQACRQAEVPTIPIRSAGRYDRAAVRQLSTVLRERSFDLQHTHGYKADVLGSRAAKAAGVPIVATSHNWIDDTLRARFYGLLDRLTLRRFTAVVAVSDAVAERLRRSGVPRDRISLISNGIDVSEFGSAPPRLREELRAGERPIVGVVARLSPEKGVRCFLQAARNVLETSPDALFVIVGEGPERSELEALAQQLEIPGSIVFTGRREDMPSVYASFDIVVLPSLMEGLPIALLEAMAAGKAIVATRAGAVPEVLEQGADGMLVPPGDSTQLAAAIVKFLTDPDLRRRYGALAQQRVRDRYSSEAMAKQYVAIYENALGRAQTAASRP